MNKKNFLLALITSVLVSPGLRNAMAAELKKVQLKQGISIACPNDLKILDSENVEGLKKYVKGALDELRPKLKFRPNSVQAVMAAVDAPANPKRQLQAVLSAPEMSQKELKSFDAKQVEGLRDSMFSQLGPVLKKLEINIAKKMDSEVAKGDYLSYFFLGYEFSDPTQVGQISVRAYYYTISATVVITFSCDKDYYTKNSEMIRNVLGSLEMSEE